MSMKLVFEMTKEMEAKLAGRYIGDLAYTLNPEYIEKAKKHGWIFHARVVEDYYEWVNNFCAVRLSDGAAVWGNFNERVYASSRGAFKEFMRLFPPEAWDYEDI